MTGLTRQGIRRYGIMAAMTVHPTEICAFCGVPAATTRGHVPGRLFFPKPRPPDLITVPACEKCNNGMSKDEEFFLATFLFSDAGVSEAGQKIWNARQRRAYDKNSGLKRAIIRALREVNIFTPTGIWVPPRMAVGLDHPRLNKVVEQIVRGLFRFETETNLDPTMRAEVAPLLTEAAFEEVKNIAREVRCGSRSWPGVFEYRFGLSADTPQASIWFVRFFDRICYWAVIAPAELLDRDRSSADT